MAATGPTPRSADCRPTVLVRAVPAANGCRGRSPCGARSTASPTPVPSSSRSPTARAGRPARPSRSTCCATCSRTPTSSRWRTSPASARRTPRRTASSASSSTPGITSFLALRGDPPDGRSPRREASRRPRQRRRARAAHPPRAGRARAVRAGAACPAFPAPRRIRERRDRVTIAVAAFPNGHPRSAVARAGPRHAARQGGRRREPRDHAAVLRGRRLPRLRRTRPAAGVTDAHPARHHAGAERRAPRAASSSSPSDEPPAELAIDLEIEPDARGAGRARHRLRDAPRAPSCSTAAHPDSTSTPSTGMRPCSPCSTGSTSAPPTDSSTRGTPQNDDRTRLPHRHDPRLPAHRAPPRAQARRRGLLGRPIDAAELEARAAELRAATRERLASLGLGRDRLVDPRVVLLLRPGARCRGHRRRRSRALRRPRRRRRRASTSPATSRSRAAKATDAPLEMTKWFDSNYHYLVPEIGPDTAFQLATPTASSREVAEAKAAGFTDPPRHRRPGHVPAAREGRRRRARRLPPARPPRRPAARLRASCSPSSRPPARSGCSSTSPRS